MERCSGCIASEGVCSAQTIAAQWKAWKWWREWSESGGVKVVVRSEVKVVMVRGDGDRYRGGSLAEWWQWHW